MSLCQQHSLAGNLETGALDEQNTRSTLTGVPALMKEGVPLTRWTQTVGVEEEKEEEKEEQQALLLTEEVD